MNKVKPFEKFVEKLHNQQNFDVLGFKNSLARIQDITNNNIFMVYYVNNGSTRKADEFNKVIKTNAAINQYSVFIFGDNSMKTFVDGNYQEPQFNDKGHIDLSFGEGEAATPISKTSILLQSLTKKIIEYTQVDECTDNDRTTTIHRGMPSTPEFSNEKKPYHLVVAPNNYMVPALLLPESDNYQVQEIIQYMNSLSKQTKEKNATQILSKKNDSSNTYEELEKQRLRALSDHNIPEFNRLSNELGITPEEIQGINKFD